jgi:outer membrane lipoprotein-sorting protein
MNPTAPESTSITASALLLPASTGCSTSWLRPSMRNSLLPRSCRFLSLWLACAALAGVAADKESTDALTAQQILDKMAETYATCKSYRDSGVVTNDFGPRPGSAATYPRHVDVKPFRTAFVRPDRFRFEYDDTTPEKPYIIWAKAGDVRTWWHVKPGEETQTSLEMAVAGATGVSSGSAHTIPALLLPQKVGGRRLMALTDLKRLPDETLDKTACFKLEGMFVNRPTTLWLDKATFLLVRMVQDSGLTLGTTVYKPQRDIEIPAADLEFNVPKAR